MRRRCRIDNQSFWWICFIVTMFAISLVAFTIIRITPVAYHHLGMQMVTCQALVIAIVFAKWAMRHGILHGVSYCIRHVEVGSSLRRNMVDDRCYIRTSIVCPYAAVLPKIKIHFFDDNLQYGEIRVRVHPSLKSALEDMRWAASGNIYTIDTIKYSRGDKWIIYSIVDASVDFQLHIRSFGQFLREFQNCTDGKFRIDRRNKDAFGLMHTGIFGASGRGKTFGLYNLIMMSMLWEHPPNFYIADPKRSDLMAVGRILKVPTEHAFDGISKLLDDVYDIMMKRYTVLEPEIEKKLGTDYRDIGLTPIVVIIDEMAEYTQQISLLPAAERKARMGRISEIARLGRACGVILWVASQVSLVESIPSDIRGQLAWKIVIGGDRSTYQTTFGSSALIPVDRDMPVCSGYHIYEGIVSTPTPIYMPLLDLNVTVAMRRLKRRLLRAEPAA